MNETNSEKSLHFLDYWNVIRSRLWLILLTFLLVLIAVVVATYLIPKKYTSKVVVEVKETVPSVGLFGNRDMSMDRVSGPFAATQYEIIQQKEVLKPVIERFDLTNTWSGDGAPLTFDQAIGKLKSMLKVNSVRGTNLIEITITSQDREEAAQLVNAVAAAYEDRRLQYYTQIKSAALRQLQQELALQQEKVNEARKKMNKLQEELGVVDLSSPLTPISASPEAGMFTAAESHIRKLSADIAMLEAQLEAIEQWETSKVANSLATLGVSDPKLAAAVTQLDGIENALIAGEGSGLGPKHPRMEALYAQKRETEGRIQSQVETMRDAMRVRLSFLRDSLRELDNQKEEIGENVRYDRIIAANYVQAKNDYQMELRILLSAKTKYTSEAMQTAIPFVPMLIHERGEVPIVPSSPNTRLNILVGVVVGLVFALFLAFFIEYLDTSVKTLEDVENALQVPVLGVIPKGISILSSQSADTPDAEAHRIIRTNIEFNRRHADDNAITIVSGGAGEGKSTTLFNLAYTFAQGGYNVLVVDADLRRPAQHHFFNVDNSVGLTDFLTSDLSLEDVIVRTSLDNLSFLPSGPLPKDAVGILNSQRMSDLIAELKQHFDLVFFDSPPILGVSDAAVLSSEVDLTVMVVQHRRFPKSMLQRVKNSVVNVGGTLLGVILNNVDVKNDRSYDYYTAYYDYYYSSQRDKARGKQPRLADNRSGRQPVRALAGDDSPDSY